MSRNYDERYKNGEHQLDYLETFVGNADYIRMQYPKLCTEWNNDQTYLGAVLRMEMLKHRYTRCNLEILKITVQILHLAFTCSEVVKL